MVVAGAGTYSRHYPKLLSTLDLEEGIEAADGRVGLGIKGREDEEEPDLTTIQPSFLTLGGGASVRLSE